MPERSRKRTRDVNELAKQLVDEATGEAPPVAPPPEREKNPAAVALGRLGGLKGGDARAKKLSPEQRSEIARKAGKAGAAARWGKKKTSHLPQRMKNRLSMFVEPPCQQCVARVGLLASGFLDS